MNALAIVAVALLWALSGVLALAETAFTRVSRIRLLALQEEGDKRARRVVRLLEHPEQTLNSILLLLLGCQMIGATILGTVLEPSLGAAFRDRVQWVRRVTTPAARRVIAAGRVAENAAAMVFSGPGVHTTLPRS